jgi:CheY-like chemotaxis protein
MLRNPVYCGALVYNKRTEGSLFGMSGTGTLRPKKGRRGSFQNASEDWVIVPGVHEPLISQETFGAPQAAMAKRKHAGGKARSVRRTLVSTLLVCKRCGSSFTTVRDTRRKPEFGPPYCHYTCAGYHRYGKAVCGLVRIPGAALDAFVLRAIGRVLQGDATTREQAIDAFVRAMAQQAEAPDTSAVRREIEQLNRRIKTTVSLLADPTFEGLDDLPAVLADLKRKRDALQGKLDSTESAVPPTLTPQQLRDWANEQFDKLERMADKEEVDLADRQLVEAFVQRIEIDPDAKTGVVVLHADLHSVLASTRVLGGDSSTDRELLVEILREAASWEVLSSPDAREALALLRSQKVDIVVTDLLMPEINGLQLVSQVKAEFREIRMVLVTAYGTEELAVQALREGAASYAPKRNVARELPKNVSGNSGYCSPSLSRTKTLADAGAAGAVLSTPLRPLRLLSSHRTRAGTVEASRFGILPAPDPHRGGCL